MSLQRLTLRAKQSLSGLYSFSDTPSPSSKEMIKTSDANKENNPVNLEDFDSYAPNTSSSCTDVHKPSPSKDSPSRRKRLMGSLRRIGSLRNMHSPPNKTKGLKDPLAEPESPCTPVRGTRQSLALNFEESPPDRPMFEIVSRNRSDSLDVQYSSPVPIPSTAMQQPSHPSDIPAGTIPISPGPMQRAFELDSTNMSPSPSSSPAPQSPLPTPMPGTNLAFEDIQPTRKIYSSDTRQSQESSDYFSTVNMGTDTKRIEAVQDSAVVNIHHCSQETLAKRFLSSDDRSKETAGSTIHYRAESFASGERESPASDLDYIESPLNVAHIVWEKPTTSSLVSVDLGSRKSTWGDHNGLYDGTGYGDETHDSAASDSMRVDECVQTSFDVADHHFDQNTKVDTVPAQVENATSEPAHSQAGYETLEEAIRSYSMFEHGSRIVSTDEELTKDHSNENVDDEETESIA